MNLRELCDSCIAEESPDSTGRKCWITPSRGNPRDSATENIPPFVGKVEKVMVRAHRNCSNTIGIVNPIWSKAK